VLVRAIRRDPDSWEPWLVFADWLSERGDARGRLIGLEHRLATTTMSAEQRAGLRGEIDELVAAHQAAWSLAQVPEGWGLQWRHGFVVGLALPLEEANLERLRSALDDPALRLLMSLRVCFASEADDEPDFDEDYEPEPVPAALLRSLLELELEGVLELGFEYTPLGAAGVELLAGWSGLSQLRALDLRYNELGDAALAPLFESGRLAELRTLKLQRNRLGPAGAVALAGARSLERLTLLDLRDNPIGADGAAALAASASLRELEALYLYLSDVGPAGARALAESPHLPLHIRRHWAGQWSANNDRASIAPASD
jgi:uncharacterized protein (TIGR02996 family)